MAAFGKIIGDLVPMAGQRFQEGLKTRHTSVLDPLDPATQFPFGLTFGQRHVVDVGEGLTEGMGVRESGGMGEEPGTDPPFVGGQFGLPRCQDRCRLPLGGCVGGWGITDPGLCALRGQPGRSP
jgi:hypothetical protein